MPATDASSQTPQQPTESTAGPEEIRVPDPSDEMASGLDALETPAAANAKAFSALVLAKVWPPLLATFLMVGLWQLVHLLGWSSALPAPSEVYFDLRDALRDGVLMPAIGHSLLRCVIGFGAASLIGIPLGVLLTRLTLVRTVFGPVLSSIQSLPAAGLVPVAIIALGNSEGAVYAVVLLGSVPSIAVSVASGIDQIPPLLLRAGHSMGATGMRGAVHVLVPAALPSFIAALRLGWTFGWRALMTAELITATPLPGIGRMLSAGQEADSMSLVLAAVLVILAVGVAVESILFRPLERRVLRNRGLAVART